MGPGVSESNKPLGTVHLAATTLYVRDLDAAVVWYREMLGLEPMVIGRDAHGYAAYQIGTSILVLEPLEAALESAPPGSESTTVNVIVDRDPADAREDLLARGVKCGPMVVSPGFHSFLMRDLDGNRFYITRPVSQEAQEQLEATITEAQA